MRRGIFWGIIISIPFWLLAIWLVKSGVITLKTLIVVALVLSAPYILLMMRSPQNEEKKQLDCKMPAGDTSDDSAPPLKSTRHHRDSADIGTPD